MMTIRSPVVLGHKIRGEGRLLNAELLCEPGSKNRKHWCLQKNFNLLVRRHFPISSVLYNDVAGYARKIVYFSGRHSLQVLAPVWYKVVLVTIFRVTRGGFSHCFHFARMPSKARQHCFFADI